MERCHHRISRIIAGNTDWRVSDEGWEWPLEEDALDAVGLWPVHEYVRRRQDIIEDYIATSSIYEFCNDSEHMQGSSCSL